MPAPPPPNDVAPAKDLSISVSIDGDHQNSEPRLRCSLARLGRHTQIRATARRPYLSRRPGVLFRRNALCIRGCSRLCHDKVRYAVPRIPCDPLRNHLALYPIKRCGRNTTDP